MPVVVTTDELAQKTTKGRGIPDSIEIRNRP